MASMASSWDDVVRRASETSGQPRGATLFLLGLALAPAIALGFPVLGVALDVRDVRGASRRLGEVEDGGVHPPLDCLGIDDVMDLIDNVGEKRSLDDRVGLA